MRRRLVVLVAMLFGLFVFGWLVDVAEACPMCRAATESDDNRPRAYMYSILFMLAVPASILTGFGIGFYRLSKRQQVALEAEDFAEVDRFEADRD